MYLYFMLVSSLVLTKSNKSNKNKRTQRAHLPLKGNLLMSACFSYSVIVSGYYDVTVTSQVAVLKK